MICNACQGEIEEGRAKCPICGFPVIQNVNANEAEIVNVRKMGEEYLKKKLEQVSIGFVAYGYVMGDDGIKLDQTVEMELAKGADLKLESPFWSQQEFARVNSDGGENVTLRVFAEKENRRQTWEIAVELPQITGFCHIGVILKKGLKFQMLLGDSSSHTMSESFALPSITQF